jgi:hypothetical protein
MKWFGIVIIGAIIDGAKGAFTALFLYWIWLFFKGLTAD